MKKLLIPLTAVLLAGCATLTEDAMTPIAMSFSDGSNGQCELSNKRGLWNTDIPAVVSVRKSDDALKYRCKTADGREVSGSITSEMGGKIVASAVFLDFGITDAITDKHRKYAESYVVPIRSESGAGKGPATADAAAPAAPVAAVAPTAPAAPAAAAAPAEPAVVTSAVPAAAPAAISASPPAPAAAPAADAPAAPPADSSATAAAPAPAGHAAAAATLATSEGCQSPQLLRAAGDAETYQAECADGQLKIIACSASDCHVMR